jgi:hypothetical protein
MKTVLFTLGEDIVARNILESNFWTSFKDNNPNTRVVLLVQPDRTSYYENLFANDSGVSIEPFKRQKPKSLENFVMSLARSGINTHTNLWSKMRSYYRGDSSATATATKIAHQYTLANFNWYKKFLRRMILVIGQDDAAREIFLKHQPDLLCALSLTNYDFDVVIAREAKRRKIPIFGMVRSWDNLSSHGLLRVVPNLLVLQNEFLKDMALRHQAISEREVSLPVIGLPHYDAVLDPASWLLERSEFLHLINVNPSNKIITYGAMGSFLFIKEDEMPEIFDDMIASGVLGDNVTLIYRGHPKFQISGEKMKQFGNVVFDVAGAYLTDNELKLNPTTFFFNLIYHSDVIVTGGSTMAIDAAVLDKPTVCVAFDGRKEAERVNYWESVKRFYDLYTHFEKLLETAGVRLAYNEGELVKHIKEYLNDPSLDHPGRQAIVNLFVGPLDGKSGQRLASLLKDEIGKV